jgi:hypothetical protein
MESLPWEMRIALVIFALAAIIWGIRGCLAVWDWWHEPQKSKKNGMENSHNKCVDDSHIEFLPDRSTIFAIIERAKKASCVYGLLNTGTKGRDDLLKHVKIPSAVTQNRPLKVTSKPANGRNSGRDIDSDAKPRRLARHEQCLERRNQTTSNSPWAAGMVATAHRATHGCSP